MRSTRITSCLRQFLFFKKDRKGATAVEFALIGVPFFALIFAIIESALFFFVNQYLETSIDDVTRLFRTGQLNQATTEDEFREALCGRMTVLITCNGLRTEIQVAMEFNNLENPKQPKSNGDLEDNEFTAPGPVQILQVSAQYKWPVYTNFAAPLVSSGSGNYALIQVVAVTRTEPYE
ncbi:MAG: TadE/TadG family type IV pilus assembly protein [Pseudomonadota bacterium]